MTEFRFPNATGVTFVQRPARKLWVARRGVPLSEEVMCGRDLTHVESVILYVYDQSSPQGLPSTFPCMIADAVGGIVRVELDTSMMPLGEWRWTLFLMTPMQPVPAYTGLLNIKDE